MAGLEKIEKKIIADARTKAEEILSAAEAEAQDIVLKAEMEAEEYRKKSLSDAENEGRKAYERALSSAKMEAKKRLLAAKQEILEDCFIKAREQILAMSPGDYEELLIEWIVSAVDTGKEKLVLAAKDADKISLLRFVSRINAKLSSLGIKASISISDEITDAPAGFLLRRGDIVINCTLDVILAAKREELLAELAAILF